ncbi:MAG: DUF86 domain-containing protein [Nitrospiraceae bacterium]
MRLNPDLVRSRCEEIEAAISRLEQFRSGSREQFLADQDKLDIACYRLLVAIEAALALCFHVSAKQLQRVPEEYAACFTALAHIIHECFYCNRAFAATTSPAGRRDFSGGVSNTEEGTCP